jgi:hypothetical protein
MSRTRFQRILAIYIIGLAVLVLYFAAHHRVAQSTKKAVSFVSQAIQIRRAYAAVRDEDESSLPVHDHQVIQKSFPLTGEHRSIDIDNVFGSIEVVGGSGNQVELVVDENTRAESKDALALAHKEVNLDITQPDGGLRLYVDGPFRCNCEDGCRGQRRRHDDGYIVKMDFVLHVPSNVDVNVRTVNEGRVVVRNVDGHFMARNVNGDIELDSMAGSGLAHTVNGPVKVTFRRNPQEIDLFFARGLSADFRFKTFNGGIYSDFPVTTMPLQAPTKEERGGKVVFRADRFTAARISNGGPEIKIENLNGDIRILENHE